MVGPCSYCGPYGQYCGHQCSTTAGYYSWQPVHYDINNSDFNSSSSYASSSSPPVDCTLSLGTPSTRLSNLDNDTHYADTTTTTTTSSTTTTNNNTKHRSSVSSFCWDLLHPNSIKHSSSSTPKSSSTRNTIGNGNGNGNGGGDPLFARRCSNCDTTSTPLWRNGPRGPKSLCNACGIRFKKEERRAAAATTTVANTNAASGAGLIDPHQGYYNGGWAHQYSQGGPQKMQCYGTPNEFRFMDDDRGSDSGIQFLSWLTHDRPSGLVHDFTR